MFAEHIRLWKVVSGQRAHLVMNMSSFSLVLALLLCCSLCIHGFSVVRNVFGKGTVGTAKMLTTTSHINRLTIKMNKRIYNGIDVIGNGGSVDSMNYKSIDIITKLSTIMATVVFTTSLAYIQSAGAISEVDLAVINTARPILDTFINVMSIFFLIRVVVSWYPKTDLTKMPYSLATWATEPILSPLREMLPPAFGVDISPIACVMVLSFVRETLISQQGILSLLEKSAI